MNQEWKSKRISRTCEVMDAIRQLCGWPTTHVYPASGGGYMALCREHARKHPEAWPLAEVDEKMEP
jgi:hypothetical protein